jgi:tRNA A-37 threonylcarbamoyl transferase component Bud32
VRVNPDSKPRGVWQPPSLAELQALLPAYEFIELIGRGGMGAVFKATQLSLNRSVAIKVLPAKLMEDADASFAARFRQEALTMAKLTHPGIVAVFESGEVGGLLYIVMEYVDGTDAARMIASEGKLSPERAIQFLQQVCDALHYAHERGVIHRDIKPANLLLTRDGVVKLADFGLAKHDDATLLSLTKTNVAIGTPDFLAPEAWTPGTELDARADIYAVGVTLYQMLTGKVPRGLWTMPSERFGTDVRLDAVIERALQPDPEARYQSSAEMRRDLAKISAMPAGVVRRMALRRKLALAAAVVVLVATAWVLISRDRPPAPVAREAAVRSGLVAEAGPALSAGTRRYQLFKAGVTLEEAAVLARERGGRLAKHDDALFAVVNSWRSAGEVQDWYWLADGALQQDADGLVILAGEQKALASLTTNRCRGFLVEWSQPGPVVSRFAIFRFPRRVSAGRDS